MTIHKTLRFCILLIFLIALFISKTYAQDAANMITDKSNSLSLWLLFIVLVVPTAIFMGILHIKFINQMAKNEEWKLLRTALHFQII